MANQITEPKTNRKSIKANRQAGSAIPQRPSPTAEQAALGIIPAAIGNSTFDDTMEWLRSIPHFDGTDEEFRSFEAAIAEDRAMRRQLASEKRD